MKKLPMIVIVGVLFTHVSHSTSARGCDVTTVIYDSDTKLKGHCTNVTDYINFSILRDRLSEIGILQYSGHIEEILPNTFASDRVNIIETLLLDNTEISKLHPESFLGLTCLKSLNLSVNKISTLENGTFADLKSLERLFIANNKIESISNGAFLHLENLIELDLSNNKISFLDHCLSLLENVKIINLKNNELQLITKDTFHGLTNLRELYLSHNAIVGISVGSFIDLQGLTILDLSHNNIDLKHFGTFRGLEYLPELDVSYNMMTDFKLGVFQPFLHLKKIVLDGNHMDWPDVKILPRLQELSFGFSRKDCKGLLFFYKYLLKKNIMLTSVHEDVKYDDNINGIGCDPHGTFKGFILTE